MKSKSHEIDWAVIFILIAFIVMFVPVNDHFDRLDMIEERHAGK